MDQVTIPKLKNIPTKQTADPIPKAHINAVFLLNALLNLKLLHKMCILMHSKDFTASLIFKIAEKLHKKRISFKMAKWSFLAKKSSKILGGMKILEKQQNRRQAQRRKQANKNNDLESIKQEKALTTVGRIIKRINTKLVFESFTALLKNQIKHSKAYYYIKLKEEKKKRSLVHEWHHYVSIIKLHRRIFLQTIKHVQNSVLSKYLKPIIGSSHALRGFQSSTGTEILKRLFQKHTHKHFILLIRIATKKSLPQLILGLKSLEKVQRVHMRRPFMRIISNKYKIQELRDALGNKKLEKILNLYMRRYLKSIINDNYRENTLKKQLGLCKLDFLLKNTTRKALQTIASKKPQVKSLSISLGTDKLQNLVLKSLRLAFEPVKVQTKLSGTYKICIFSPKYDGESQSPQKLSENSKVLIQNSSYIYIPQLVVPYLTKLFLFLDKKYTKFHQKPLKSAFSKLKTSISIYRTYKSANIIHTILENQHKKHKNDALQSILSFINTKKHRNMLWRVKFYQLEGLLQKKHEDNILKLKHHFFKNWKVYVDRISSLYRKYSIKRATKMYALLQIIYARYRKLLCKDIFGMMKNVFFGRVRVIYTLERIYSKNLVKNVFEGFRRLLMAMIISPKGYRKSQGTPVSFSELSPRSSLTQRNNLQQPKRYGFYSVKRLSLDQGIHGYIDKMIKSAPPAVEKCASPNIGNFINRSSVGEPHSRNRSFKNN